MDEFTEKLFSIQYPDDLEKLCCAVGLVVVNWAFVEQKLDNCINWIFCNHNGKNIAYRQEFPQSLKKKVAFMRKALRTIKVFSLCMEDGLTLMDKTSALSKQRHIMIHGIFINDISGDYGFAKYDYIKDKLQITKITFSVHDYFEVGKKMLGLANELNQFLSRLLLRH